MWSRAWRRRDRQWCEHREPSVRGVLAVGIKLPCGGGQRHARSLSGQLDPWSVLRQVNATREKEPQHASEKPAQQQHLRSPRVLAELARFHTGPSREVLVDDLHRNPVTRPRPFAIHEGHRVVGGRPVDEYELSGDRQRAMYVSPFFGRGECLIEWWWWCEGCRSASVFNTQVRKRMPMKPCTSSCQRSPSSDERWHELVHGFMGREKR